MNEVIILDGRIWRILLHKGIEHLIGGMIGMCPTLGRDVDVLGLRKGELRMVVWMVLIA